MQILSGVTISDFPSGVRFYFDKARGYVTKRNPDPAGYHDDVGKYLNTKAKVDAAVSRLETGYSRAIKAERLATEGRIEAAVGEWRKIFGDRFPAYG